MNVRYIIDDVLTAYYKSGVKVNVNSPRHSYPGYVRASSLGGCPLAAAREKLGIKPDLPTLVKGATVQSILTLQGGEYAAMQFQEALLYAAQADRKFGVEVEVDMTDHVRKVSGRADASIGNAILEFKYTFADKSTDPGEPRESHAWQLMTYARARYGDFGVMPELYLVTIGKYDYKVWELKPEDGGFSFYDTTTDEWLGMGFGGWNEPTNLTYNHLDEIIDTAHAYMQAVKAYPTHVSAPIENPFTDPKGYTCIKTTKDYKKNKGIAVPNCPWALSCHGIGSETAIARNGSGADWELAL